MKWKRQINADNCNAALIDSIGLQRMKYISCVHNFDAFDDQCLAFDHRRRSRAIAIMFCHVPFNVLPFLFHSTRFICCFRTSVVWRRATQGARQNDVNSRRWRWPAPKLEHWRRMMLHGYLSTYPLPHRSLFAVSMKKYLASSRPDALIAITW